VGFVYNKKVIFGVMAIIVSSGRLPLRSQRADEQKKSTGKENSKKASLRTGAPFPNITADHSSVCKMLLSYEKNTSKRETVHSELNT